MLYLFACAAQLPYVRTAEDMAGDWVEIEERARLNVRFDTNAGATATLTDFRAELGPQSGPISAAAVADPSGTLHFSTQLENGLAFHSLRFGDPDTLIDELRVSDMEISIVFRRDTPESHAAHAAAKARIARAVTERELYETLQGIRIAELAYDAAFDQYVPCGLQPRAIESLTPTAVEFHPIDGFDRIGWAPDRPLTGTYQVTVSADGRSFTVDGWQDLDGDGVPAHWSADEAHAAHRVSPEGVR